MSPKKFSKLSVGIKKSKGNSRLTKNGLREKHISEAKKIFNKSFDIKNIDPKKENIKNENSARSGTDLR